MARPFALLGFSAYAALALAAALGPAFARPLALLCLGLAGMLALSRAVLGGLRRRAHAALSEEKESSELVPGAPFAVRLLFWAACALAAAGVVLASWTAAWEKTEPWQSLEGRRLTVRGQVLDYPEERYHRYYYRIRVTGLGEEGTLQKSEPFVLRLSASMPLAAEPYDWVECAVTFSAFDGSGGLFSTRSSRLADGYQAGGYLSQYEGIQVEEEKEQSPGELLARLRRRVGRCLNRVLPEREAGLLRAMLLGDAGGVSEEDTSRFRQLGVSHILVVSGLHMTVLAAFLQFLLRRFPIRKAVRNGFTGLVLLLFLALSGFSPSACRGAAMYGVLLLADSFGRRADSLNSLGLAVLAVCLGNPFAGGDLGFALSVLATLGIILVYPSLYRALRGHPRRAWVRRLWNPVAASLAVTAAATLGTFPVQLAVFGGFPLLTPMANLLLVFPSTVLLYLTFCGAFLALLPATAGFAMPFLWAAGLLARLFLEGAGWLAQGKGTFLPLEGPAPLAVVLGLLLLLLALVLLGKDRIPRRIALLAMAVLVAAGAGLSSWRNRGVVTLVVPAAGEDSCAVLIQGDQGAVLSLGGYRTGAVAEIFQRYGVRNVTVLCLPDRGPDAREAAAQVLKEYGGEALVVPEDAYVGRDLELARGEAPVRRLPGGAAFPVLEGVEAEILPRWEGLRLAVNGTEVLVEWDAARSQTCGVLVTNQAQTRVNSSFTLWQTDVIIGKTGEGWEFSQPGSLVLPVEEGSLAVRFFPSGEISARRER